MREHALRDVIKADASHECRVVVPVEPVNVHRECDKPTAPKASGRAQQTVHCMHHVVCPTLFLLWGYVIAVVHISAEAQGIDLHCRLPLRPWLSLQPACSLVEIDCHPLGASGSAESLDNAWTVFDPALAAGLLIRHCPQLTIPSSIELFTGITTMKVYNATITSRPMTAGLTTASHSRLRALYLVRTNFTDGTLPPGLVRTDFPQTLRSVYLSATNVTTLPDDLDRVWPQAMSLVIEFAYFTSIPDVVLRLHPGLLSFSRCPIASLPPELLASATLRDLFMSYTALQELPRNVANPPAAPLNSLFLEGTNVSTFWSWLDPLVEHSLFLHVKVFNAHATPYCRELQELQRGTRQSFSAVDNDGPPLATIMDVSTPQRLAGAAATVTCWSDFETLFPLARQDALSAVR